MLGEQPPMQRLKGLNTWPDIVLEVFQRAGFFLRTHVQQVRVGDARLCTEVGDTVPLAADQAPQHRLHRAALKARPMRQREHKVEDGPGARHVPVVGDHYHLIHVSGAHVHSTEKICLNECTNKHHVVIPATNVQYITEQTYIADGVEGCAFFINLVCRYAHLDEPFRCGGALPYREAPRVHGVRLVWSASRQRKEQSALAQLLI